MSKKTKPTDLSSEIAKLKEQIVYLKKMAALGELTAAISHEIKNPLSFIKNFSQLSEEIITGLQSSYSKSSGSLTPAELQEQLSKLSFNLTKVVQNCDRVTETLERVLGYARDQQNRFRRTEIHALLNEFSNLIYATTRVKNPEFQVLFKTNYDVEVTTIETVSSDLSRVFINLLNNAFASMLQKKKQSTNSNYTPTLSIETKREKNVVRISIRDNGVGIHKENIKSIFDRFFSTKNLPDASGLGLPISYEIVKQHNGKILVTSEAGEYADFTIELPIKQSGQKLAD